MKNFGRFTYYGSLGGYSHVWSTTDPPIDGARILLNEDGNTYVALRGDEHPEPTKEEIAEARALVVSKNFGRFIYHGSFSGHSHVWSTTNPPAYGARIALSEDGSLDHTAPGGITYPEPTAEEVATAQAMVKPTAPKPEWDFGRFKYQGLFDSIHRWFAGDVLNPVAQIWLDTNDGKGVCITDGEDKPATEEEISSAEALVKGSSFEKALRTQHSKWDFGRFKYNGKFIITNSYMPIESRHTWYTAQGSKIGLREDGSLAFTCETHGLEKPTAFEIAKAQALVKHTVFEETDDVRTQTHVLRGSQPNVQKLCSVPGDPRIVRSFGRFVYIGRGDDWRAHWSTHERNPELGAQIIISKEGEVIYAKGSSSAFDPTPEEVHMAQVILTEAERLAEKSRQETATECAPCDAYWQPLIHGPRLGEPCPHCGQPVTSFTNRDMPKVPKFSGFGDFQGSPLIKSFGRFIYFGKFMHILHKPGDPRNEVEPHHLWATSDPPVLANARIALKEDGSLLSEWPVECPKPATPEEIGTARNMVLSANLVKQVEEGERPVIRSTAFYRNKEKTEDPPFNQLSRGLGTAVFHQLMNMLKPKESKPLERFHPGPVYRIKPHVLSLPLLDPSTHARHHCLYTERYDVFKIAGLAMWGISEDTTLNISIGGQAVFDGDVPAQMFANGLSFHELYQILELKEPPDRIVSQDVSEDLVRKLRTNVKWRALEVGLLPPLKIHESLELNISGLAKYAVFWGYRRDLIHD